MLVGVTVGVAVGSGVEVAVGGSGVGVSVGMGVIVGVGVRVGVGVKTGVGVKVGWRVLTGASVGWRTAAANRSNGEARVQAEVKAPPTSPTAVKIVFKVFRVILTGATTPDGSVPDFRRFCKTSYQLVLRYPKFGTHPGRMGQFTSDCFALNAVVVRDMLNTFPETELKPNCLNYRVILASNRASRKV